MGWKYSKGRFFISVNTYSFRFHISFEPFTFMIDHSARSRAKVKAKRDEQRTTLRRS